MFDVVVIGAGVTGCAIARELSAYDINVCVLERGEDLCSGTSKANSAIVHAGFDAKCGSKKALYNVRGSVMMEKLCKDLDVPYKRNGSLVTCSKDQDRSVLRDLLKQGEENGVEGLRIVEKDELKEIEPNLSDDIECALLAETGAIICPFHLTYALGENAAANGAHFRLNTEVTGVAKEGDHFVIDIKDAPSVETKIVVNAAGVYADDIHNMVSKNKLHIVARKGQYFLLDKTVGNYVTHTVFQLPGKMGKGVLMTPTVHGNILVGPNAEDIEDKEGTNTTLSGMDYLTKTISLSIANPPLKNVITSFAGLRAHEDGEDFVIGEATDAEGFFDAAGIESPGLSSAPAIGEDIAKMVAEKLGASLKTDFVPTRKGILNPAELSFEERNKLIKEKPEYGQIICRCESISEGEILDAIHRPLGARSLDGVKRRTRAGMGRCQSGFCSPKVMEILERELNMDYTAVTKNGGGSQIVYGENKQV
ncbi:MAG: NAD(P)/FAD-dependent oxidoreductase [Lachnospiraceae bacterium]|nr:NAD(P)/FAD-dependent oxidoreductase [Lachnospiraceae bacterium]